MPTAPRSVRVLLVLVLALAAGLRAPHALHPEPRQGADERAYAWNAVALRHGAYPNLQRPPGAPALFAAASLFGGRVVDDPLRPDLRAAYWAQALVGTLLVGATFVLAAALGGAVAGLVAALVVAVHPPLVRATGDLLTEPLAALLVTAAVAAVVLGLRAGALRWAAPLAGALAAGAVLTRASLLPVPVVLAAVVLAATIRRRGRRTGVAAAAAFTAAAAVLVVPWSVHASRTVGEPVVVAPGGGVALFVGTYLPGRGQLFWTKKALAGEARRHDPRLRGVPAAKLPGRAISDAVAARRPHLPRDAALRAAARENVARALRDDPAAFAGLLARKVPRLWWRYSEGADRRPAAWRTALHRLLVAACALALALALWRRRDAGLVAAAVVLVAVTSVHVAAEAIPRYALPAVPLLVAAGTAAAARLLPSRPTRRKVP